MSEEAVSSESTQRARREISDILTPESQKALAAEGYMIVDGNLIETVMASVAVDRMQMLGLTGAAKKQAEMSIEAALRANLVQHLPIDAIGRREERTDKTIIHCGMICIVRMPGAENGN